MSSRHSGNRKRGVFSAIVAVFAVAVLALGVALPAYAASVSIGGTKVDMDTAVPTKIDDSVMGDAAFQFNYKGDWSPEAGYDQFFNGTDHYSNTVGDSWSMKFTGPKIDVYGSKNPAHGTYAVTIDGKAQKDIVATAGSAQHKQLLGSYEGLDADAEHTITVELKSGGAIQVDYVVVERKPVAATDFTLSTRAKVLESGSFFELSYSVSPKGAVDPGVTYDFDEKLLEIDENGVVTAKQVSKKAVTSITAALNNESGASHKIDVTIYPQVEGFNAFVGNEKLIDTQEDWEAKKADRTDSWSGTAWLADERASKIGIATRAEGAKNVRIIAGDLVAADGSVISGKDIEVKWLRNVQAKEGRNAQGSLKSYPDVIYYDNTGMDVPANTLQYAWLTIPVSASAHAGTYTGTVQVVADGVDPVELTYTLEVIGIKQPTADEADFEVQVWQHPFSVSGYYFANSTADAATGTGTNAPIDTFLSKEHKDLLRGSLKEYASIGGHDLVANIVEEAWNHQSYYGDTSMVTWILNDKGEWTFDYTLFDKWIAFATECGVIDPATDLGQIKCYSMVSWGGFKYKDAETGEMKSYNMQLNGNNPEGEAAWTAFLKDFYKHCQELGIWDITYISMDERDYGQLKPVVDLVSAVEEELGINIKLSSALNVSTDQNIVSLSDKIDDISVNTGNVDDGFRGLADARAAKGFTTTIYNCTGNYPGNFMISDPGDNYWAMWYAMSSHADGFMRWAWDNWTNDMFGNATYRYWEPGDGWYIYPLESADDLAGNPDGFYSTPRYEMFKQGIRDVCKAKYLVQNEKVADRVMELVESLQVPRATTVHGAAVAQNEEQRMLAHSETDRMYDGINEIARELAPAPEPEPQPDPKPEPQPQPQPDPTPEQKPGDDQDTSNEPNGGQSKPGTDGPLAQTGDPALFAVVATGVLGAGAAAVGYFVRKRTR